MIGVRFHAHNRRDKMRKFAVLSLFLAFTSACVSEPPNLDSHRPPRPQVEQKETVTQASLFSTEDFDLPYAISLLQQNMEIAEVQRILNTEEYGITNVDVLPCTDGSNGARTCGDGNVDFIVLRENRPATEGNRIRHEIDFMAYASPPANPDTETSVNVASVNITSENGTASVEGVYPEYAQGHQNAYYRQDGLSFAEAYLLASILRPNYMPMMYQPAMYSTYAPRQAYTGGNYRSHASSMNSPARASTITRQVTTVTPTARPATVSSSPRAQQTRSSLAARPTTTPNNRSLAASAGTTRSFSNANQNSTAARQNGSGFNQRQQQAVPTTAARPAAAQRPAVAQRPTPTPRPRATSSSSSSSRPRSSFSSSSRSFSSGSRRR